MHPIFAICHQWRSIFALIAIACCAGLHAQKSGLTLDPDGAVVLIGKDGHRAMLAEHGHCNEGSGNPKNQFFACAVSRGVGDQGYRPVFQIEVYLPDGHKLILEPGGAIREWHLWNDYRQISVSFDTRYAHQAHALYDARTGKLLRQLDDPADPSQLPQWAKSRLQIDNESVPMDQRSQEIRKRWITKALIQIGTIKPGMHRRDLDTLFRMDGGLQFNSDTGRYDLKECPSIKVDVHFVSKPKSEPFRLDPIDIIESISKPYLEFPFAD